MTLQQQTSPHIISVPRIAPSYRKERVFALSGMFQRTMTALRLWRERSAQRRALGKLDDRLLKDIGLTREQARRETLKLFWQD